MATDFYSDQTSATPHTPKGLGHGGTILRTIKATVTFTGTQIDEDDMFLLWVPAGTVIVAGASCVHTDGTIGATCTINVGTETSSSVLATALDMGTGVATIAFDEAPYTTTVDEYITADIEAIGTPAAGVLTFYLSVIYPS